MKKSTSITLLSIASLVLIDNAIANVETYHTHGIVKEINIDEKKITLFQDCVSELGWPVRNMTYHADGNKILNNIKTGDAVDVVFTADSPYQASVHFVTKSKYYID